MPLLPPEEAGAKMLSMPDSSGCSREPTLSELALPELPASGLRLGAAALSNCAGAGACEVATDCAGDSAGACAHLHRQAMA